jgi:TPR repeat protein
MNFLDLRRQIGALCLVFCFALMPCASAKVPSIDHQHLDQACSYCYHKDYPQAYSHFKKMADNGCPYSQCILGLMHKDGVGVPKDPAKAADYFRLSAHQGFADAQRWLGHLYLTGQGVPKDPAKAKEWLQKAATHGVVEAQYELGNLESKSDIPSVVAEGKEWLKKAAGEGLQKVENGVAQLPPIPGGSYQGAPNSYSEGLSNIQEAWTGYANVAKSLSDAVASQ